MEINNFDREISKKLKSARIASGCSQSAVGACIGVSSTMIHKYENGESAIRAGNLYKISKFLNVDISSFFNI